MEITKDHLIKATELLRTGNVSTSAFSDALKIYSDYRQKHWYVLNTFQATLRKRIERKLKIPKNQFIVAFRSKRVESVIIKLKDKDWITLDNMQDIGGVRAIVNSIDEVYKIAALYETNNLTHEFLGMKDHIKIPRPSGYRSIHLKFKSKYNPGSKGKKHNGLRIELQVRTKIQHYWATAVEIFSMHLDPLLKLGKGEKKYVDFFQLASKCFALHENKKVNISLFKELYFMNDKLDVIKKLFAFNKIMDIKKDEIKRGAYIVIYLTPDDKKSLANFYSYPKTKKGEHEANLQYSKIEKDILKKKSIDGPLVKDDVVMVSGTDIKRLKIQFPNYFSDASNFITTIQSIFNQIPGIAKFTI